MTPIPESRRQIRPRHTLLWLAFGLAAGFLVLLLVVAVWVTSFFRLSSDTAALRDGMARSLGVKLDKRIALRVGGATTGLVRLGTQLLPLDPEARAAIATVRGAEVGVYELRGAGAGASRGAVLAAADKLMEARGWERVVGVVHGQELVAVYCSGQSRAPTQMEWCVVVSEARDLVVVAARANLQPLLPVAQRAIHTGLDRSFARVGYRPS